MEWWHVLIVVICSIVSILIFSVLFYRQFFKRFWDIVLSSLAIILLLPLYFILSIVVLIGMGHPVLFSQERIGKNGKIFKLYKFRSMTNDKDENGKLLPEKDRLTKFGILLRSTSLDELPELFLILLGKMSIIGPRPQPTFYGPYYTDEERKAYEVRGGLLPPDSLTKQVQCSWEEQLQIEVFYAKNVSFWLDIKVLVCTFLILFKRLKGNYGANDRPLLNVYRKDWPINEEDKKKWLQNKKMREYIVFVSRDHYNPVGIVRSLGEAGIRPIAVVVKTRPKQIGKSKYVKKVHYVDDVETGIKLIIEKYSRPGEEKSIILTGDDVSVVTLDKHYDQLKDNFYFYNAGRQDRLLHFMNKDVLNDVALRAGFNVARTWKVKTGIIPDDIRYPVITKAINSFGEEWKSIVFVCRDDEELKKAFSKIKSDEILVQQYIEKKDEKSFEGFSIKNGNEICLTMVAGQKYTIDDKYTPYWNFRNFHDDEFYIKAKKMIKEIGFEGIWEFEFLEDKDGKLWFLEINFRNTVLGWATTVAGMSSVILWTKACLAGAIPKDYYREIPNGFTAIAECFDYDVRVKNGLITKKEWKKQFKNANAKLYLGRNDFRPFLSFMVFKLFHGAKTRK